MKRSCRVGLLEPASCLVGLLLLLHVGSADAYIDPGSGMLVIQGLIAAVAGVVAFMKSPIAAIRRLWRRWTRKDDA
jgi:hypothetical protein